MLQTATTIPTQPANDSEDINQLNSFLRGELSAVETYDQAIDKCNEEEAICATLVQCRQSHQERVAILEAEIRRLGGSPTSSSGVWGSFAKIVEGGAAMIGLKAAVQVLEEGEQHGLNDYERAMPTLPGELKRFVREELFPKQQQTHTVIWKLKDNRALQN